MCSTSSFQTVGFVKTVAAWLIGGEKVKLQVKVEHPDFVPVRKTAGSAGLDLRITNNLLLKAGEVVLAGTGVKAAIPEGYVGLVVIRSGISLTGVELVNGIGVIDSDYRGEIKLPLRYFGRDLYTRIPAGTRVAQLLVVPYLPVQVEVVDELDQTDRGEGGFGSTGSD